MSLHIYYEVTYRVPLIWCFYFLPFSSSRFLRLLTLSSTDAQHFYILPPLTPPVCPPPSPGLLCARRLSPPSLPRCQREEAALPLPSSLLRTIHACSLTFLYVSLSWTQTVWSCEAARLLDFVSSSAAEEFNYSPQTQTHSCLGHERRLWLRENSSGNVSFTGNNIFLLFWHC